MSRYFHVIIALSLLSLPACAAPPASKQQPTAPTPIVGACQPQPCVTLNAQEMNVLGPVIGGHYQQLQQELQNLGVVVQDIQKQMGQLPPQPAQPPQDKKK